MMREFSAEFFARSPLLALPVVAMGIFLTVFVLVLVVTLLRRDKEFERASHLPLDTED